MGKEDEKDITDDYMKVGDILILKEDKYLCKLIYKFHLTDSDIIQIPFKKYQKFEIVINETSLDTSDVLFITKTPNWRSNHELDYFVTIDEMRDGKLNDLGI